MKTSKETLITLPTARSLFERLKLEYGVERAQAQLTIILENAELWQKISKELYSSTK